MNIYPIPLHIDLLQVYLLMEQCWDFNPGQRPSFQSIAEVLEGIRAPYSQQPSVQLAQINHRWPALFSSSPSTTALHCEPDHTWLFVSLGHIFRKEDVYYMCCLRLLCTPLKLKTSVCAGASPWCAKFDYNDITSCYFIVVYLYLFSEG